MSVSLVLIIILYFAFKRDDPKLSYWALVIITVRNILPFFDLDGVSEFYTTGNSILLLALQFCGVSYGVFCISVSYMPLSNIIYKLGWLCLSLGLVASCYTFDAIKLVENYAFAIISLLFTLLSFMFFVGEHKEVFQLLVKEILESSKANQTLRHILRNLD